MNEVLRGTGAPLVYVASATAFFLGLKSVLKLRTASRGRPLIAVGLVLAAFGVAFETGVAALGEAAPFVVVALAIGALTARGLSASAPPARVAWIPGVAGAGSAVAAASAGGVAGGLAVALGLGALALGGALLSVSRESARTNAAAAMTVALAGASAAFLGLASSNVVLLVVGGVGGTAGVSLGRLVATKAGRSLVALLSSKGGDEGHGYRNVRSCSVDEAAMILETAGHVVLIPGFGMAAAHAQHAVAEAAELLRKKGARVTWAIHPDAGCVPGHMNIALDEANVAHDPVLSMADAGAEIARADAVVVIGGNDIVNPAARVDGKSPVYGLDVPDLAKARRVFVIKRSLRPGATGARNPLFEQANATMVFGDAKKVAQALVAELKGAGH